jgi:hypothetical protein
MRFVRCYRRIVGSSSFFLMTRLMLKNSVISIEWLSKMPLLLSRNVLLMLIPKARKGLPLD